MKKNIQNLLREHKKKYKDQITYFNDIELIIDEVCVKTGLNKGEVKKIVDSQFRMLKQVMGNEGLVTTDSKFEEFKSIRLLLLGSFRPSPKKFKYVQKYLKDKDKKDG